MSFNGQWATGSTHLIGAESEELHDQIWTQLGNDDTPSIVMITDTHDGVPSHLNAVYIVGRVMKLHHLLPFDDASNMVNKEN